MSTKANANTMSDDEVVRQVLAGELTLFEILMRRYNRRLYRVTRAILGDDGEAEDVMQEAYVRAYTYLNQFAGQAKFSTWLTKIAMHEAMARVRRRRRFVEIDSIPKSDGDNMSILTSKTPNPEQQVIARELNAVLEAAVDTLPETYRSVFMLREIEGMSTAETAECLDISEETTKTRLYRARALLRGEINARIGIAIEDAFQFAGLRCDRVVLAVFERIGVQEHQDLNPG